MKEFIKKIGINKNYEQQEYCVVNENDYNSFEYNGLWLALKSDIETNNYPDGVYEIVYFNPYQFIVQEEFVIQFDLDSYKTELESAVDVLVNEIMTQYWYQGRGDIAINILDNDSIWQDEAIQLSKWINSTYSVLRIYLDAVTEENHISIQSFVDNLVEFNYP